MAPTINVFVSSFPGLGLPPTLCLPTSSTSSIQSFATLLSDRLPEHVMGRLRLSTSTGKAVNSTSMSCISTLLPATLEQDGGILSLRLSVPLLGGKGGFGSQLRAAGGRMSSRKKRNQGDPNASSRNLDGRRLRTVTEAKALAEYLAVKPEMDKKEKEERRRRWEQVVEAADRKREEILNGGGSKAKVDGKWIEEKEEAESKTREAIAAAMKEGLLRDDARVVVEQEDDGEQDSDSDLDDEHMNGQGSSKDTTPPSETEKVREGPRRVFGWDEDDEDMSDSDEDESDIAKV